MRNVSLGHLTLNSSNSIKVKWSISVDGETLSDIDSEYLDWNYYSNVVVSCRIDLDICSAKMELMLGPEAALMARIIARSTSSLSIHASDSLPLSEQTQTIDFDLTNADIGGTMTFELVVALQRGDQVRQSRLAPSRIGHILYEETRRIRFEGTAPRLPMLPVEFSQVGIPSGHKSKWWLKVLSTDLYTPASAALWLWINSENIQMRQLLADSASNVSRIWLDALGMDFARQLLREGISHDELDLGIDYPEDSLGAVLSGVLRLVGESVPEIRAKYADDAGQLEALLQGGVSE